MLANEVLNFSNRQHCQHILIIIVAVMLKLLPSKLELGENMTVYSSHQILSQIEYDEGTALSMM